MTEKNLPSDVTGPNYFARETRVAFCGHIDHGKSTLLGRLLLDTGGITPDRLEVSIEGGGLAFLLDGLAEERDGLVTIDTAQIGVEYKSRHFRFIDLPGHAELVKNMMTGATQADSVVLVVDANGNLPKETAHQLSLLALIGIDTCVLAVTKIETVEYSQPVFETVMRQVREQAAIRGLKVKEAVPVSAIENVNITNVSQKSPNWYTGPSLMDALTGIVPPDISSEPMRFLVQGISGSKVLGKVLCGTLRPGDLLAGESDETVEVLSLERFSEPPLDIATPGQSIALQLNFPSVPPLGTVLSQVAQRQVLGLRWRVTLVGFTKDGLLDGARYELRPLAGLPVTCWVDLGGDNLPFNVVGDATLTAASPTGFDIRSRMPTTRFVLHPISSEGETGRTSVGVGMVRSVLETERTRNPHG